ncbi:hypothetical protein ElyMa_006692700 [Elysia marginata]|uniref:Secreted protein n=1 Tax=Elysia marginata TaxID=1093978 RepID=A0AAV4IPV8_9GAST|nr:hypothetical protein ElyMa_006692700 [Elysia marginata]
MTFMIITITTITMITSTAVSFSFIVIIITINNITSTALSSPAAAAAENCFTSSILNSSLPPPSMRKQGAKVIRCTSDPLQPVLVVK